MKPYLLIAVLFAAQLPAAGAGWVSLFNGKDFTGWKVNENPQSFTIQDGAIVAHGPRSHCFYVGNAANHSFQDFELKVDVMTRPGSNGGIYIDTEFQNAGWPGKGFEVQVNNTFVRDPRKTASLYEVQDVTAELVPDNQWFEEHILAHGHTIVVKLNGKPVVHWAQPADWKGTADFSGRRIGPGTIALQSHDAGSTVYYKNIRLKLLR